MGAKLFWTKSRGYKLVYSLFVCVADNLNKKIGFSLKVKDDKMGVSGKVALAQDSSVNRLRLMKILKSGKGFSRT